MARLAHILLGGADMASASGEFSGTLDEAPGTPLRIHIDTAAHSALLEPILPEFRQAVADWYQRRFNVRLDSATEVVSLIGSKEGIGNMAVAFVDPGDVPGPRQI